jgi:teichoic acid glycerol-phosphate primase
MMRAVGLLYGPEEHHLDHLAVVCLLMQIPLIVTEEEISSLAKKYYPGLNVLYHHYSDVSEHIVANYELIFSTLPKILIEEIFFFSQRLLNKRIHSIWCPHGNSDKGYRAPFMEGLQKEEIALAYGQKMLHFMQLKTVFDQLKALIFTGNFRYTFYKKERDFYQNSLLRELNLPETKKTLLYAPTWQDSEQNSSFFSATPLLIELLPEDYSLIIKPHPHLYEIPRTESWMLKYEDHPRVRFLKSFPPVYPLLDKCDIYIGDMSSIGYDFLTFNKPMFFLNESERDVKNDPGLYLYRCGVEILPKHYSDLYKLIDYHLPADKDDFSKIRQQVYDYTFGKEKDWQALRLEILNAYHTLPDPDLNFF